jgi:hypothetical protein
MKKLLFLIPLLGFGLSTWACPACEKQQPKLLKGISHGAGPSSNWDYVIILAAVVIVLATLFYTIKWLVQPGEKETNHIKRTVLNFN